MSADAIRERRLDALCTQIQETGEATDLPEYLLAAAKQLGITEFVLTDLGVVLYKLRVVAPPGFDRRAAN